MPTTVRMAALWAGVLLAAAGSTVALLAVRPAGANGEPPRVVVISPGGGARQIAGALAEGGVIRSRWAFLALAALRGDLRLLKPGEYEFTMPATLPEVEAKVAEGRTVVHLVTFPEGFAVREVAARLGAEGLADPDRLGIAGWSWGGYLTLLLHGMHPDRFRVGVAGVPVGDYALGYEDLSPLLQAYDRALLGGTPAEVPQLMAERSPISYVDDVKAPILFLAGEADSRCPLRQVLAYTDRLAARNHPHELYLFPTGHAPFQIDERINQTGVVVDFLARHVPGIRVPG